MCPWRPEAWDSTKQVAQARMSKRQEEMWPWDMHKEAEAQMCALGGQTPVVSPTQVTKSRSSPFTQIYVPPCPTRTHLGAVNWTWIIWKSNTPSKNPSNLSSIKIYFNYVHVCAAACGYVHVNVGTHRSQKRASDTLELELQAVGSHQIWVLDWTSVLSKSSKSSQPQSYFSSLSF